MSSACAPKWSACCAPKSTTSPTTPARPGSIGQASVLEAGITDAASAHRMVEGGYGQAPSELSGKGATLVLSDILLVQRRVPSDKRPKRFMLQNVGQP